MLTLSGITVTGGNASGNGGGLFCAGNSNVTLDDMVFVNNAANSGGAIALSNNATLTLRNSVVTGNRARTGGGIFFFDGGSLVMEGCTVSRNTATGASQYDASGGGIYFFGNALPAPLPAGFVDRTLLVRDSTFSHNTAAGGGGAVALDWLIGTFLLRNSTVSGNTAGSSGGGVYNVSINQPATIALENSTVTGNAANQTAPQPNAKGGGGIAKTGSYPGAVHVTNSVVSGNTNTGSPDILAHPQSPVTVRFSAVGSASGFTLAAGSGNNRPFGANLLLGPLGANGGPTLTHALLPTSPLLNAGGNALVPPGLTNDQRGPGFPRVAGGTVDVGAYERPATVNAPRVSAVFVGSGGWQPVFRNYLAGSGLGDAAAGYAVPSGADQLDTLPWIGLDRVSIRFTQGVQFSGAALSVVGVNTPTYTVGAPSYDAATATATWALTPAPSRDKVILRLNASMVVSGGALDGEWANGAGAFPSGNGSAGGDFVFRLNYLAGDTTRDRTVLAQDYSDVKKKFFKSTASPVTGTDADYGIFHDIDGSGMILAFDYSEVKNRFFDTLPGPEPAGL